MANPSVAIVGYGYVGKAYHKVFDKALIYDPPQGLYAGRDSEKAGLEAVNKCEIAIVSVPTDPTPEGPLDMSIVESVVKKLDTDFILIKSALNPGTVDRLVAETGKKIAVSVEYVGMGNYYIDPHDYPDPNDPRKHQMIVIGGEEETATYLAQVLWDKMSPTIRIHVISALEAEITKLVENTYGALKVSWVNALYNLATKGGGNFVKIHQAWTADNRVDGMHQRTTKFKRGWTSHCWDKDIPALAAFAENVGAKDMVKLIDTVMEINAGHLEE